MHTVSTTSAGAQCKGKQCESEQLCLALHRKTQIGIDHEKRCN